MPKMSKDDEDWTKIQELTARRRLQNRISQRNHRQKIKTRLEQLEAAVAAGKWQPPESDSKDSNQAVADSNQEDADTAEDQQDLAGQTEPQVDDVFDCFTANPGNLNSFSSSEVPNHSHQGLSIDPFISQPPLFQQSSASSEHPGSAFFGLPPTPMPSDFDFSQEFSAGPFDAQPDPGVFDNTFHSNDSAHVHLSNVQHDREQNTNSGSRNKPKDSSGGRGREPHQPKSRKSTSPSSHQHSDQKSLPDRRYERSHRHSTSTSAPRGHGRLEQSQPQRPTQAYTHSRVPPSPASSRAESSVPTTSMRTPDIPGYSPAWSHRGDGYFPAHAMSPRSNAGSDEDSGYSESTSRSASKVSDYCPNCACRQHRNPPEGWITIQIPAHYVLGGEDGTVENRSRYRD